MSSDGAPQAAVKERQSAARTLKKEKLSFLLTIRQATIVDDEWASDTDVQTWALLESVSPGQVNGTTIHVDDRFLILAALIVDANGDYTETVLQLKRGDRLLLDGIEIPVIKPGATAPSGHAILYEPHAGARGKDGP